MKKSAITVAAVILMAGCSGGDSVAAPTTQSTATSTSSSESTISPTTEETPTSTTEPTVETEPEPTAAPETSAPEDQPIEALLGDRVRAYFATRLAANGAPAPNPDDPALAAVAAGSELEMLVANTQQRLDDGQALRPGEAALADVRVGFVEVTGDNASLSACSIDDEVIFDLATGDLVNDEVITHNYQIDLALLDGTWKITDILRIQQWEGVGGCALATGDYPF